LLGVLQFRVTSRYSSSNAPVTMDHSDSAREGCAVTFLTINADPRDWQNCLAGVVQEIRAICDFGITESEMNRYKSALLKDMEMGAREGDSVPSEEHVNFAMTSDVFDHTVMDPVQSAAAFQRVAPYVTLEHIHDVAKWMLGYIGYYGHATASPPASIIVCTPTKVFDDKTMQWVNFDIQEEDIANLLVRVPDMSKEDALNQVDVPQSLLKEQLQKVLASQPIDAFNTWRATMRIRDEGTGIVQLVLPNGAKVNYCSTANESYGNLRLLIPGGHNADLPDQIGASMVGIRTMSEAGTVSDFSREQMELFAVSNMLSINLESNLECARVDTTFATSDEGEVAIMELIHLLMKEPRWEMPAFMRAQRAYKNQAQSVAKSLEQSTRQRLMAMMYNSNKRVLDPTVEDLNKLDLGTVKNAVMSQLRPQDIEIDMVADFTGGGHHKEAAQGSISTSQSRELAEQDPEVRAANKERRLRQLDDLIWRYLGSVPSAENEKYKENPAPCIVGGSNVSEQDRLCVAHLEDTDMRATANIGGGAPNRWGTGDSYHKQVMKEKGFSWRAANSPLQDHALYSSICLMALREIVNTRLFTTLRDQLGLSYDSTFELSMFDQLEAGWFMCTVSTHPDNIDSAVQACKDVLAGVRRRPVSGFEVAAAARSLLRRHEADLGSNEYRISLLENLQYDNPKDTTCVRDMQLVLSKLTDRDVQNAYNSLLTDELFVSISTAGPGPSFVKGGAESMAKVAA